MAIHDEIDTPLARACRAVGSQSALARLIGKHQTTISERLRDKKTVWAEDVLVIEEATGISRHDLRPDLYPREEPPAQPPAGNIPPPAGGSRGGELEDARI